MEGKGMDGGGGKRRSMGMGSGDCSKYVSPGSVAIIALRGKNDTPDLLPRIPTPYATHFLCTNLGYDHTLGKTHWRKR